MFHVQVPHDSKHPAEVSLSKTLIIIIIRGAVLVLTLTSDVPGEQLQEKKGISLFKIITKV